MVRVKGLPKDIDWGLNKPWDISNEATVTRLLELIDTGYTVADLFNHASVPREFTEGMLIRYRDRKPNCSKDQFDLVMKYLKEYKSVVWIHGAVGCSTFTIQSIRAAYCDKLGIKRQGRSGISDDVKEKVRARLLDDESPRAIADSLSISIQTVYNIRSAMYASGELEKPDGSAQTSTEMSQQEDNPVSSVTDSETTAEPSSESSEPEEVTVLREKDFSLSTGHTLTIKKKPHIASSEPVQKDETSQQSKSVQTEYEKLVPVEEVQGVDKIPKVDTPTIEDEEDTDEEESGEDDDKKYIFEGFNLRSIPGFKKLPKTTKEILFLHVQGKDFAEIAEAMYLTRERVERSYYKVPKDIITRLTNTRRVDLARLMALRKAGWSTSAIAEDLRIPEKSVLDILRKHGDKTAYSKEERGKIVTAVNRRKFFTQISSDTGISVDVVKQVVFDVLQKELQ